MSVTLSLTEDQTLQALRAFLLFCLPTGVEVVRGQDNLVAMPAGPDFVVMTPILRERLATNEVTTTDNFPSAPGTRSDMQSTKVTVQVDVYGPSAADNSQTMTTLFRSSVACEQFAATGFAVTPLYADDARQLQFTTDQSQNLDRWTFSAVMHAKPVVTSPQDFAGVLTPGIYQVDAKYGV